MKRLIVHLDSKPVGALEQDRSGLLSFTYAREWLDRAGAIPLSRSLPLQPEPFKGTRARPFFAGILPEEAPRAMVAAILGISKANDFAMLDRIGGECAGAVHLLPEGTPFPRSDEPAVRELTDDELRTIITELPRRPLLAGEKGIRLSLAGAQPKLPVVVRRDRIALPLNDTPSTHILKPEPERFAGLVTNEYLCMRLARSVGLAVPEVTWRLIGGTPCLIVLRYDRIVREDQTVQRVHQEDFCQALGVPPERKYQQEGGPLIRDCIGLLREWSTIPALDLQGFLDGLIFNTLIGNADAHGKNYSLLYSGADRRLAPLYDLVCTLAYPELSKTPAMKIGKSERIDEVTPTHWEALAKESPLNWPALRERVQNLARRTLEVLGAEELRSGTPDATIAMQVAGLIEQRTRFVLAQFESRTIAPKPASRRSTR